MLKLNFNKLLAAAVTVAVAFSMLFGACAFNPNGVAFADAESEGFVITDYQVDVTVTEDRVYKVTENITCDFNQEKHGIYRCIPTSFKVERADGSRSRMTATIENFEADTAWEKDSEYDCRGFADAYYSVRLGDADRTVTGEQSYSISYDYVCSPDTLKDADEFYFNVIGAGWDTDIEHVVFNVTMPKKFDEKAVGFSMGSAGIAGTDEGELLTEISGLTVSGETLRTMEPGEALTIRIELPDGYFTGSGQRIGFLWIYMLIIIMAFISAFLCWKWGRDDKIIPVIQFNPPEGYNSLDVGVMDHLDPKDSDVLSLLVYLADKGYLTIEPEPDRHGNVSEKTKKFIFHKVKEYDGDNVCERVFLEGLFSGGSSVRTKELKNSFYKTVKEVCSFEKGFTSDLVWRKGRVPITIMILAAIALMCLPALKYGGIFEYLFSMAGMQIAGFLVGIACLVIMIISWALIQRRTPLGVELAGKARGFAEFLETAEKDRIEQMIEEDPLSFYKIIPYAMALGVTDKWIEKFKGITVQTPGWYIYDSPVLEGYIIGRIIGSTLNSTMTSVSAAPASSGGGGISGGGAGGGGGGSW